MSIYLLGGGSTELVESDFARELRATARMAEAKPALLALGDAAAGAALADRLGASLVDASDEDAVRAAHGVAVLGTDRRAIALSIAPISEALRDAVGGGAPYLGIGAGAALAGDAAILGGGEIGGVPVGPVGDDDEVELGEGAGLVDLLIEVNAIAGGTLPRLIAVAEAGLVGQALSVDAGTALIVGQGALVVQGAGSVWQVVGGDGAVTVSTLGAE